MRNLVMMLLAASLTVGPAAYATSVNESDPDPGVRQDAAQAAEAKGDQARLAHSYEGAVSLYLDAIRITPHNAMLYNKVAISELQLGSHRAARHYFDEALKIDAHNTIVLNNLGALYCTDGKYKQAVHYLKEALALNESDATAHLNMAEAWMGMKETDRAMTEYSRALEL